MFAHQNPVMSTQIDPDVFKNGRHIFSLRAIDISSRDIESWSQHVSTLSGQKVDWANAGASLDEEDISINVYALGDYKKIAEAMKQLLPELNQFINNQFKSKWRTTTKDRFTIQNVESWFEECTCKHTHRYGGFQRLD